MKLTTMKWATPTLFVAAALAFSACADPVNPNLTGGCPPGSAGGSGPTTSVTSSATTGASTGTGSTEQLPPGGMTTGKDGNTFDHFNDPGASGLTFKNPPTSRKVGE